MRRLLKIILSLVVLLILVAVAVPFLVPADKFKGEVLAQIEAKTGRKVTIDHLAFSLFPSIALDAEGVSVANPDWAGGGDMAQIKTLKIGLELFPLLHKEVRLTELTLKEPVLKLVKQGAKTNWDFSKPQVGTAAAPVTVAPAAQTPAGNGLSQLGALHLGKISIVDGSASYKDDASGKPESITELNFTLKAPTLSDAADITFTAVVNGKKADITLNLTKPLAFAGGEPTHADLKVSYSPIAFTWSGTALLDKTGIPALTGKLNLPSLNTSDFASDKSGEAKSAPASAPASPGASHWSDAPIDLSALKRINADLTVTIGKLVLPKTTLENIDVSVQLAHGVLHIGTNPINAYGGTVKLTAGINASGPTNAVSFALQASHAQAEPLLHDFAGYDRLSGTIDLASDITASGNSQRALVSTLAGNGNFHFSNGKLKGVDLPGLLHNVTGAQASDDSGTDFSDLSGSFTAARGIITTNDLKMNSPLMRMTGAGNADLPNWQEHILLKPMLVATLRGQGTTDAPGIIIPVDVEGPLDHPHYQPDLKSALVDNLKNPGNLKQGAKDLKNQLLQGKGLGGLLR